MEAKKINVDSNLSFSKLEYEPGRMAYVFDHVVVGTDVTGKNYKELPEIVWGTFDTDYRKAFFNQPDVPRQGVTMEYISRCIKEVAKDSGINKFWLYPYGDDSPNKEKREEARARLFKRYLNITPESRGFGYVLTL